MSSILILGAGLAGLTAASLLARAGHEVRVIERDRNPAPDVRQLHSWARPGLHQLPHIHLNLALWRELAERELPELPQLLEQYGALRLNLLSANPAAGTLTAEDRVFETITARRRLHQAALEQVALDTPGVSIIRGERVSGLEVSRAGPVPLVTGVRTAAGARFSADLIVDATGRRSALSSWLQQAGLPAVAEQRAERGSVYYSRHFRSRDGQLPGFRAGTLQPHHGLSLITLPADNGSWSVAIVTGSEDAELRTLREPKQWSRAFAQYPLARHWGQGEPLSDEVAVMAALHDQNRSLLQADGSPLLGGLVLLGDAWASTDPTLGRGSTLTLLHALLLRDALRAGSPSAQPAAFTAEFERLSTRELGPLVQRSNWYISQRLAEMHADASAAEATPAEAWQEVQAARQLELTDKELARGFARNAYLFRTGADAFPAPQLYEQRLQAVLTGAWSRYPQPGPRHAELVQLLRRA